MTITLLSIAQVNAQCETDNLGKPTYHFRVFNALDIFIRHNFGFIRCMCIKYTSIAGSFISATTLLIKIYTTRFISKEKIQASTIKIKKSKVSILKLRIDI